MPYALKAADADTLGGKPASAYLTVAATAQASSAPRADAAAGPGIAVLTPSGVSPAISGTGTTNYLPLWTSSTNLGNSIMSQIGTSILVSNGTLEVPNEGTATNRPVTPRIRSICTRPSTTLR